MSLFICFNCTLPAEGLSLNTFIEVKDWVSYSYMQSSIYSFFSLLCGEYAVECDDLPSSKKKCLPFSSRLED